MGRPSGKQSVKTPRWLPLLPPTLAAALLLWACGGGAGGGAVPGPSLPPDDGSPYGLSARPAAATLAFPLVPATPGMLDAVDAFPNLSFVRPVFLGHAPDGTDRVFVVEQGGRIYAFPND